MNEQSGSKAINLYVAKPGNCRAKAGPMRVASALRLAFISGPDLNDPAPRNFESRLVSLRLMQMFPR